MSKFILEFEGALTIVTDTAGGMDVDKGTAQLTKVIEAALIDYYTKVPAIETVESDVAVVNVMQMMGKEFK